MRLLVRTWNLFHGNSVPTGRKAYLDEMVRLASADRPDIVCLQELPVWALDELGGWSGMTAVADVAQRPLLWSAEVGRLLTDVHHGLLRSAFTGQANAILLRRELRVVEHECVVLNPADFRRAEARRLGLGFRVRLAWRKERRVCQVVRVVRDGGTLVVGNLHATSHRTDKRLAEAEVLRAAACVDGVARGDEPVLLCGDFNLSVRGSQILAELTRPEWGFSGATPTGIDHVLVRGLRTGRPERWPDGRRRRERRLLSDHAPIDVEVA